MPYLLFTESDAAAPHLPVIDMGDVPAVTAIDYLPRAEQGAPGAINEYKIYLLSE